MKPLSTLNRFAARIVLLAFVLVNLGAKAQTPVAQMQAHFINVGQADAALLEFPCGAILIDAGAQDNASQQALINYLNAFFHRRQDLHNTLDLVIISHDHVDHDHALPVVATTFHIKNYIDNGHTNSHDSGEPMQANMEAYARAHGIQYENFSYEQALLVPNHTGLADQVIDPVHCSTVTPKITILSGRFQSPTDLDPSDFNNENNHSLVVRVQFGRASFLFTGDLQIGSPRTGAGAKLINAYGANGMLDADVWKVSHHGAENGTTAAWVHAITPLYAVISCGQWNYGLGSPPHAFNTYNYGHPRISTINYLSAAIPGNRPQPIVVKAASGAHMFSNVTVTKNIYATPWDGNITINATSNGQYTVITHDH